MNCYQVAFNGGKPTSSVLSMKKGKVYPQGFDPEFAFVYVDADNAHDAMHKAEEMLPEIKRYKVVFGYSDQRIINITEDKKYDGFIDGDRYNYHSIDAICIEEAIKKAREKLRRDLGGDR